MSGEASLAGKVALVTGGARGIGRGIALELARAGASVCLNDLAAREAEAEAAVAELEACGRDAFFAPADVTDRAAVEAIVDTCETRLGPVDVLVSNAVTSRRHPLLETSIEELARAVEVSVYGAFHVIQVVARRMVAARRPGAIVQITSPWARIPYRGGIDYAVAKAGAHMLAMAAANELSWHGVRVNLVEPGWVDTPGEHRWFSDAALARGAAAEPLGRLADPADIGRAVVFLAAEPYIVGTVLRVDGGHSLKDFAQEERHPREATAWPGVPAGPAAPSGGEPR